MSELDQTKTGRDVASRKQRVVSARLLPPKNRRLTNIRCCANCAHITTIKYKNIYRDHEYYTTEFCARDGTILIDDTAHVYICDRHKREH